MTPDLLMMLGGGFVFLLILAAFWPDGGKGGGFDKRLSRVGGDEPAVNLTPSTTLRRQTSDSEIPFLDKLIKSTLPNPDKLRARLGRTGRAITPGAYLMVNGILIIVFYLVLSYGFGWAGVTALFMGIALGLLVPHKITGRMGNKRVSAFLATFPEAIDTMCRGLRSGLPLTETIATVGGEMPDPIGIEFRRVSDGVRMGRTLEESMWEVEKRLDTPEFRFFIIAMTIQKETGGNLGETLGNLSDLLRKRRQMKLKIKALSSEARASAMIIGSLPFLMFTLLYFVNPEYISVLFTDTRGKILLGAGISWLSLGVFCMKQMVNFEI